MAATKEKRSALVTAVPLGIGQKGQSVTFGVAKRLFRPVTGTALAFTKATPENARPIATALSRSVRVGKVPEEAAVPPPRGTVVLLREIVPTGTVAPLPGIEVVPLETAALPQVQEEGRTEVCKEEVCQTAIGSKTHKTRTRTDTSNCTAGG